MRSLYALNQKWCCRNQLLSREISFSLTGVLTNTKYVHIYLQEQAWEHSAVKATKTKSFETSAFQHKFHKNDKKDSVSQIPLNFSVPPLTYQSSPRPEHLTGEDLSISKEVIVMLKFTPEYTQEQFTAYWLFPVQFRCIPFTPQRQFRAPWTTCFPQMAVKCTVLSLLQRRYLIPFWNILHVLSHHKAISLHNNHFEKWQKQS